MSWSGPNPRCDPALLLTPEHPASITTSTLEDAAKAAGTDIPGVVANLVRSLAIWTAQQPSAQKAVGSVLDTEYAAVNVVKTVDEARVTTGIAYPCMRKDVAVAADRHIDYVGPEALQEAAWSWMTKHRDIGLHHAGSGGCGEVVESYISAAPAWSVKATDGSEQTVHPGDWMLSVRWPADTWALIKSGKIMGYSPQGGARRVKPTAERLALLRS